YAFYGNATTSSGLPLNRRANCFKLYRDEQPAVAHRIMPFARDIPVQALIVACLVSAISSGCASITRTTRLIQENQDAVEASTRAITRNEASVRESTESIRRNREALDAITAMVSKVAPVHEGHKPKPIPLIFLIA